MPHIRALFIEDDGVKELVRNCQGPVRLALAEATGYKLAEIAFIPDMVPKEQANLARNMLPLEFVIDVGSKCIGKTEEIVAYLKEAFLAEYNMFPPIHFGIWVRVMPDNSYVEHKPKPA